MFTEGFTTPLQFPPGKGWLYGSGNDLSGIALERLKGQGLGAYMQQNICDPLEMKDTGFWPEKLPQVACRTAPGSLRLPDGTLEPFHIALAFLPPHTSHMLCPYWRCLPPPAGWAVHVALRKWWVANTTDVILSSVNITTRPPVGANKQTPRASAMRRR